MDVPRHRHQTQPLYRDRFDRVSPLNSRRSNTDSYHDNKTTSLQNQRHSSKSLRRHSTNAYTSSSNTASQKELSPTSTLPQSQLQQQMNNNSSRYIFVVYKLTFWNAPYFHNRQKINVNQINYIIFIAIAAAERAFQTFIVRQVA